MKTPLTLLLVLVFDAFCVINLSAQTAVSRPSAAKSDDKAEQILQRAIEAQGGRAYLEIHTIIGRGLLTPIEKNLSSLPSRFVDYQVLPDKERTEFRSNKVTTIQVNTGSTGWIFDGATRAIKNLTPAQVEDFHLAMRTSVDNVLRGWWRSEGAKLQYVGRREAGLARRNEVVRLTYPDGFSVEYEFDAKDFLPAKILYQRKSTSSENTGAESADAAEETLEEDRLLQYTNINGINTPLVIDHYRDGKQTSRINFESIDFNKTIPDSLFARPSDIKKLK